MIGWVRHNWWAVGVVLLIALAAHAIGAGASGFTMNSPPGARQVSRTNMTVTSSLQDQFTIGATANLDGQITDFNGGNGFVTPNNGPTWAGLTGGSVSSDWSNNVGGYVTRNAGGANDAVALVDYVTRESTISVVVSSVVANVRAGVINGSDATGTKGVIATLIESGGIYYFGLFRVDTATTVTQCSTLVDTLAVGGTYTISLTYTPASSTADVASARLVKSGGGGPFTVTNDLGCQLDSANGRYAGMASGQATTTRYDNFSAVL